MNQCILRVTIKPASWTHRLNNKQNRQTSIIRRTAAVAQKDDLDLHFN